MSDSDVTVDFATNDGSATAPDDYTHTTGTVTILAGDMSVTTTVAIVDDNIDEADEEFTVALSNAVGADLSPAVEIATVTIVDNDVPTLSIGDVTVSEGAVNASITVTSDIAPRVDVTVSFATADGTATTPGDYTDTSGTATILAGQTTANITVPITDDEVEENDETFTVTISNPSGEAAIVNAIATVTIEDDDGVTVISVDIPLVAGFNLIGMPVVIEGGITAKALAETIDPSGLAQGGIVASILRWDAGFVSWLSDFPDDKNFLIEPGQGYFIRLTVPHPDGKVTLTGAPPTDPVSIGFVAGFNLIGVPFATPAGGYDARTLAEAIDPTGTAQGGIVASILRWDAGFESWLSDFPDDKKFAIDPKAGYFVRLTEPRPDFVP